MCSRVDFSHNSLCSFIVETKFKIGNSRQQIAVNCISTLHYSLSSITPHHVCVCVLHTAICLFNDNHRISYCSLLAYGTSMYALLRQSCKTTLGLRPGCWKRPVPKSPQTSTGPGLLTPPHRSRVI